MPVQSSNTSVRHWPTADFVLAALREWAGGQAEARPELAALGYFGSHARGDSGFGSDLDLVAIVERSEVPRMERNRDRPYEKLPVPADLLVFHRGRVEGDDGARRALRGGDGRGSCVGAGVGCVTVP